MLPWIRKYPQLFVARTFSKAAGLAALRLGAVMACRDSLSILRRAMPPFPVNAAALVAAEAALQEGTAIRGYVKQTRIVREKFAGELRKLGVKTFPSAGNFLLADFGAQGPALFKKLAGQGILVRERTREIGPGFVRISMTTAYHASFDDARKSLATLRSLAGHRFVADDVDGAALPTLVSYKDTTDAHLVTLANRYGLKLATLDAGLIAKPWAVGVAENPL